MNDDFEKRLQRVAPREIPSGWREEILSAARHAETGAHAARATDHGLFVWLASWFNRPQRLAWSGLGAAWVLILLLNNLASAPGTPLAQTRSLPSPQAWQALKQQKQLLAELDEHATAPVAERPRTGTPGPHSQRPTTTTTV
jgi:hypothetical protein